MTDALFVYGSLRSEFDNEYATMLRHGAELLGRATVRGSIFLPGRYPGFRREPDGAVHGEIWKLRDPQAILTALDEYEGSAYRRIAVPTSFLGMNAWIYEYVGEVEAGQRIESGDFLVR